MSFLWNDRKKTQLLTFFKRSSPKHNDYVPCFAQSKKSCLYDTFPLDVKRSSIKETLLHISSDRRMEASMTVEAAVVLPLFLFFFLTLGGAIEMIRLHGNLEVALWEAGNKHAVYGHMLKEEKVGKSIKFAGEFMGTETIEYDDCADRLWVELGGVALTSAYIKDQVVSCLGTGYLEASPLLNGEKSLNFTESDVWKEDDTFEIIVTYKVAPLGKAAGVSSFRMVNKYYGHLWTGYKISETSGIEEELEEYVYVAENGEVYHVDRECTHLRLSVREVRLWEAMDERNKQGEKYDACEICCEGMPVVNVYITDQGECFHYMRECPGLRRTVHRISFSEAEKYPACTRCAA